MKGEQRYKEGRKPPQARRAEKERQRKRAKQRDFAEALREYQNDPEEYVESRRDGDTLVGNIDDDSGLEPPGVWVPYVGSQGGQGWENTRTGKRKYQLEKPGTNSSLDEPIDVESRWRDPPELCEDDADFDAPLSPGEFREFSEKRD